MIQETKRLVSEISTLERVLSGGINAFMSDLEDDDVEAMV